jgi:hypothetical protein
MMAQSYGRVREFRDFRQFYSGQSFLAQRFCTKHGIEFNC